MPSRFDHADVNSHAKLSARRIGVAVLIALSSALILDAAPVTDLTNSVGIKLARIEAGDFRMGNEGEIDYTGLSQLKGGAQGYRSKGQGTPPLAANPLEWDETPSHHVRISQSFLMATTPVTNAQFEQFRPAHRALRGKQGFSKRDDEAVIFVSWGDATEFCAWLSRREGRTYRLPTEAEWEYACRAGTTTAYNTGAELPEPYRQHQVMDREHLLAPDKVSLVVGATPPNAWGLHDMHGIVEEWCLDWYGPYMADAAVDPVGWVTGVSRVTRGGSHSTGLPFLRSANRSGALPDMRTYLIGFRVVAGPLPATPPLSPTSLPRWARNVAQTRAPVTVDVNVPIFLEPHTYTRIAPDANGPLFITHNHCPSVTVCPNGDLLAIWFTTVVERGREMVIAGARLRHGAVEWDKPDVFLQVPDRNLTGSALWWDGDKTLYHINGISAGDDYQNLALMLRTSSDNGASWSEPKLIGPEFQPRHQVIDTLWRTRAGELVLACDSTNAPKGGTAVLVSTNLGSTWIDHGAAAAQPKFEEGGAGAWIAGIHAGMVELNDGRWFALGRNDSIKGRMPASISEDRGRTWRYEATELEPIGSAQRLELMRLREGPLLLVSFAKQLPLHDAAGNAFSGRGMFAALSFDDGKSWPIKKLITPGDRRRVLDAPCNRRWGEAFSILDYDQAESRGYLTGAQSADGMIHLLSSGTHYSFNLAWLKMPSSVRSAQPQADKKTK
jgi:sulfatase modifying factor 1